MHTRLRESFSHPTKALSGYVYNFMKDVVDSAYAEGGEAEVREALGALFYPDFQPDQLCSRLSGDLFVANTCQVTKEMSEAVTAVYVKSAAQLGHIDQEELPWEAGFVWLDTPFVSKDKHLREIANRAVSWAPQAIQYADGMHPGVRICAWYWAEDKDDYYDEWVATNQEFLSGCGPLLLSHVSVMPFGQRFGGHPVDGFDMTPDDFAHWIHTLWMFLGTEITVARQPPVERHARKRAAKSLKFTNVNVIVLRKHKIVGDDPDGEARHIDWSCRWVVQGHHRHLDSPAGFPPHHATPQPYDRTHCAVCGARITWVKPYLKGPDDRPLRTAKQIYKLQR